jgi:hypothetical protein
LEGIKMGIKNFCPFYSVKRWYLYDAKKEILMAVKSVIDDRIDRIETVKNRGKTAKA